MPDLILKKMQDVEKAREGFAHQVRKSIEDLDAKILRYAKNLPYYIVLIKKSPLPKEQQNMLCENLVQYALNFLNQAKTHEFNKIEFFSDLLEKNEKEISLLFPNFFSTIAFWDVSKLWVSPSEVVPILELERERIMLENKLKAAGILDKKN